jgi:hypothetical protein
MRSEWTITQLSEVLEERMLTAPFADGGNVRLTAFLGHYGENKQRWDRVLDMWDRRQKNKPL